MSGTQPGCAGALEPSGTQGGRTSEVGRGPGRGSGSGHGSGGGSGLGSGSKRPSNRRPGGAQWDGPSPSRQAMHENRDTVHRQHKRTPVLVARPAAAVPSKQSRATSASAACRRAALCMAQLPERCAEYGGTKAIRSACLHLECGTEVKARMAHFLISTHPSDG